MDDRLREYRAQLIALEQKAQESYDRTVLTLSGGALGVSFAFVTKFVERGAMQASGLLVGSWISWAFSVTVSPASHFTSHLALRRAIDDLDAGRPVQRPSWYDRVTAVLNITAGALFLVGVLLIAVFVWRNVMTEHRDSRSGNQGSREERGYRVPPPPPPSTEQSQTQQSQPETETPKSEK